MIRRCLLACSLASMSLAALPARADGLAIDKVYHPYVDPLGWELEWRATHSDYNPSTGRDRGEVQRLGLARAVAPNLALEGYLIGSRAKGEDFDLAGYELEALWQLTEQGERALDYGLLFELERANHDGIWEAATTLLLERELGRFSATANLELAYEGGGDISNELETGLALQGRYRLRPEFEPSLELYMADNTRGLGPVAQGLFRLGLQRRLHYEAGVIFGVDDNTPDVTLRVLLEYEF
jgi:hypothetical protein